MSYKSKDTLSINQWKIKSLPPESRPDEKLESYGAASLSDAELLAIIIRTGFRGYNSVRLAEDILKCGKGKGLIGLCQIGIEELTKVRGVGKVKAIQLKAVAELTRRISKRTAKESLVMDSPETVARYFMEDLRHRDKECFMMLSLDSKGALISESLISIGTVNASLASPREVFVEAVNNRAVSIILVHNHPSGNPKPSKNDLVVTRQMKDAGELLGIKLIDHIIIGDNSYVSLSEEKMM
ncbi:MAG: DNA repair protein RadC [Lachnospiraceae bacterium]|nr:DNA repair protein RadC [Lachnospiraceae bacterium]MEE0861911.1 DNA repair protein RadC [Lachnospiraceae bacterium]